MQGTQDIKPGDTIRVKIPPLEGGGKKHRAITVTVKYITKDKRGKEYLVATNTDGAYVTVFKNWIVSQKKKAPSEKRRRK